MKRNWELGVGNWVRKNLFLLLSLPLLLALSGCENITTETTYHLPNWTPEGLIYAEKVFVEINHGPVGGGTFEKSRETTYVTMDENGENEKTLPYNRYPYFSPKGTHVLTVGSDSTFYIFERQKNVNGNDIDPGDAKYTWQPTTEAIQSLDWGPDEERVVWVVTSSKTLFIADLNGDNQRTLASPAFNVAWRYGQRIIYDASSVSNPTAGAESVLFDGSQLINHRNIQGGDFNISKISTDEVIYFGKNGIEKARFSAPQDTPGLISSNKDLWFVRLNSSPQQSNQKIVASGPNIRAEQIWLININGTGLERIK